MKKIFILTGEPSGDKLAQQLFLTLKLKIKTLSICVLVETI